ncbi:MAG: hypothetical protein ACK4HW_10960 [Roseinatronobacter sp.]
MAPLYLHIGAHKTATTYLQSLFALNRDTLSAAGILYPATFPYAAHHQLARLWINQDSAEATRHLFKTPQAAWQDVLTDEVTQFDGVVFLSSEVFSEFNPQKVNMAELAARLAKFDDVRVIYTLRSQPELVNSIWLQHAKKRTPMLPHRYAEKVLATQCAVGAGLSHLAFYQHICKGFDPSQIILLRYDDFRTYPGGVGQVFLDLLGAKLDVATLQEPDERAHNISPDALSTFVASRIQREGPPPAELIQVVAKYLYKNGKRPSHILTRPEYEKVCDLFAQDNARLAEMVQRTQPGFSFEIGPAHPDTLFRDQVPTAIWPDIALDLWTSLKARQGGGLFHRAVRKITSRLPKG